LEGLGVQRRLSLALVMTLIAIAAVVVGAQGRGRGGAPGPGGPQARAAAGTVEKVTVHGKALEGNLEGDSPDREVTIYLPPTYADQKRRFPVLYLLHGYGGRDDTFTQRLANLAQSADRLSPVQGFSDMIVVMPNAYTLHKGSMYSNSPVTGDWEKFVAEDLVSFVDGRYRTIPDRMSRGLAGHSMGGYGTLRIGMKRPDVFSSLYSMSACCLTANRDPRPDGFAAAEAIKTRAQAEAAANEPGFGPSVLLASAAAWSPNPKNPPLFVDLPVRNGKVRPDIVAKWVANAPLEMVAQHAEALRGYYQIAIDIGTKDTLLESNRQLRAALLKLQVPHEYEEYEGDHTSGVRERIERNVLVFFSKNLAAPANPSSPVPQKK
jgi:enterochelin esterase-like enzyme